MLIQSNKNNKLDVVDLLLNNSKESGQGLLVKIEKDN
jgi:hypothetical protein